MESTTLPLIPPASELRASLSKDGFVLIPSLLTSSELSTLRAAALSTISLARSGSWPHLRTLPKQFPPWPSTISQGIWGIQHLLHPDLPASPTFATSYFHPAILTIAARLLLDDDDDDRTADSAARPHHELVLELYNLLIRPDADFALRWHRDDIGPDASSEEEVRALCLGERATHAQWNLALWDDESLVVVPGSHARARTDEERGADPYEGVLGGLQVVRMRPGDAVFYDNNILHRGVYRADRERATLHGSVGLMRGARARARNVLQHGIGSWIDRCDFSGLDGEWDGQRLSDVAQQMRERLKAMGGSEDVQYYSKDE